MLLLTSTSDKVQVTTSAAGTVQVHSSYVDNASGVITPARTNTPSISTATTTDVVASPAASTQRNVTLLSIKNNHASVSQNITVQHTDGTNIIVLWTGTIAAGESVVLNEMGEWYAYTSSGVIKSGAQTGTLWNASTASMAAGLATDTYITNSNIAIPLQGVKVGSTYRCVISVSKTAAGTATPIVQVRIGTAATTADTSRLSFTFSAGTAATDVGLFKVIATFRTVGSGTSAVLQGHCALTSQPTTGFSSLLKGVQTTSAGFDSTTANSFIGVSINGGASAVWTVTQVFAELINV